MDDVMVAAGAFLIIQVLANRKNKNKTKIMKKRTIWMRRPRENRTLLRDLNNGHLLNFARMTAEDFENLIQLVGPRIAKQDTHFRKCIPVQDRLAVTLRFLATGDSYTSLQYWFKISKQLISLIVMETCEALIKELKNQIKIPVRPDDWLRVSNEFEEKCQFPHCVGAMGGKHVALQIPFQNGSDPHNDKSDFNIVLFAMVDADYNFILVDVVCQTISDVGVFKYSPLYKKLDKNSLNLPQDSLLSGLNKMMPYVIVANEAFPLTHRIMKPYCGMYEMGRNERNFNFCLSRARRKVENVFGILPVVFRVLRKPMLLEPEKAQTVVMAVACLHNYLRSRSSRNIYTPEGTFDREDNHGNITPGSWRLENSPEKSFLPLKNFPCRASNNAKEIRNDFARYFSTNNNFLTESNKTEVI